MAFTSNVVSSVTSEVVSSGTQTILYGGTANCMTVFYGGYQNISSGGVANSTGIGYNGYQNIFSGGVANSTAIEFGSQYVSSGGIANSTTINYGGEQYVSAGGAADYTNINSSGGQTVSSGGVASHTAINSGGWQTVLGTANSAIINSGGKQYISWGGVANSVTVNSLGGQYVNSGGTANSVIINACGMQNVFAGGIANSTSVNSGGCQNVSSGGVVNSTAVNSGGGLMVSSGGSATGFTIGAGGILRWDFNTVINGTNNGAVVTNSGGKTSYNLDLRGYQYVSSGYTAHSTTINSGGKQYVLSGGAANSTTVNSGGSMYVSSGGIASGALTIDGGHVTIVCSDNLQPSEMSFKLANAHAGDALLTIQSGKIGDISQTAFTLDVNNTVTGSYILGSGADLTGMSNAEFTVADNGQNINVQVGSSYTFADGDILALNLTDAATDQLTAAFTTGADAVDTLPPSVPDGLKQTVTGNNVAFDWADSSDKSKVKQYDIRVDDNSDFSSPEYTENVIKSQDGINNIPVGTYYWQVRAQDKADNWSDWSKSYSFTIAPTDIAANTWQKAADITNPANLDNWVGFNDPADVYKLTMINAGTLTLGLNGLTGNADLSLLSAAGAVLKTSVNPGTAPEAINNVALLAGTYYVKVAAGTGVTNAAYTLKNTISYFDGDTIDKAGNTIAAAIVIGENSSQAGWVGFGDPADYFKLTMTGAGTLTLNLTGLSSDANLTLYDAKGKQLNASNNKNIADENITNPALPGGDYYIKVTPADGGRSTVNNTGYTLKNTISYFAGDTIDKAGNTIAAAKVIGENSSQAGWVGFGDPADYYKLTMTSAGTLTLNLTGLSSDANLTLYDAKGKQLNTSNNKNIADENITNPALPGGDYYIKVTPADGGKSTVNNTGYTLKDTISYFAGDTIDNAGNTFAAAKLVDASLPAQSGWVGLGDSDDYYRFAVAAPTQGTLHLDMTGGNADLSLYDSNGKLLQKSAKTGTSEDMITRNLTAGIYYARVNAVSGYSIGYTLTFDKKALAGILAS